MISSCSLVIQEAGQRRVDTLPMKLSNRSERVYKLKNTFVKEFKVLTENFNISIMMNTKLCQCKNNHKPTSSKQNST